MHEIGEITRAIAGMTPAALVAMVLLGAFALAAFAIYAVLIASKGKR